MRFLRSVLFYVILSITITAVAIGCIVTWPFTSNRWRYRYLGAPWNRLMIGVLRSVCGVRYELRGLENIPSPDVPVVVLSKHQSAWETMFLPGVVPQRISYVYKKSLHWVPCFGWALKSMGMIAIDRSDGRAAYQIFMRKGAEFLKNGWWVALFPEGTRVPPGERVPYKSGGARFAVANKAKVLPVALNSGHCWPKNGFVKHPGTIVVSFGPLIDAAQMTSAELNTHVETWIEDELKRIEEQ
ncbi:MAG: 1-acyl-sn-glycerol-3-phosphate acyltransferase [Duodenibacillus sp.]|nr:1-acyl-sn-glycerol-3-phosphate acyltransferase [Duodenibacillus sp.]